MYGSISLSFMNFQMILVISSPSSSTTGLATFILLIFICIVQFQGLKIRKATPILQRKIKIAPIRGYFLLYEYFVYSCTMKRRPVVSPPAVIFTIYSPPGRLLIVMGRWTFLPACIYDCVYTVCPTKLVISTKSSF